MMTTGTLDAVIKPFKHSSTTYSKDTDGQTKIPILTLDTTLDDLIGQKKDSPPALDSLRWNFLTCTVIMTLMLLCENQMKMRAATVVKERFPYYT